MTASNSVTERGATSAVSLRGLVRAGLKVAVTPVVLLVGTIAAGTLIPVDLPAAKQSGPLAVMRALLLGNAIAVARLAAKYSTSQALHLAAV